MKVIMFILIAMFVQGCIYKAIKSEKKDIEAAPDSTHVTEWSQ